MCQPYLNLPDDLTRAKSRLRRHAKRMSGRLGRKQPRSGCRGGDWYIGFGPSEITPAKDHKRNPRRGDRVQVRARRAARAQAGRVGRGRSAPARTLRPCASAATATSLNSRVNLRRSMTHLRLHQNTYLGVYGTGSRPIRPALREAIDGTRPNLQKRLARVPSTSEEPTLLAVLAVLLPFVPVPEMIVEVLVHVMVSCHHVQGVSR